MPGPALTSAPAPLLPQWAAKCERVTEFVAEHGAQPRSVVKPTNSRQCLSEDELTLGAWCTAQRQRQRQGRLEPDRAARLEAIPGWRW